MSLPHALLTSLLEKPCSGAELARRFDKSIGHFWQASHQQIYRDLGKLESEGLIAARGLATARGSQRHFDVLPDGHAELERWSRLESDPKPVRDELLVRLRAAAVLGTVDMSAEIRRHMGLHRDALQLYRDIAARDFPAGASTGGASMDGDSTAGASAGGDSTDGPAGLQLAVLRAGIAFEEAWLAWCAETLAGLD